MANATSPVSIDSDTYDLLNLTNLDIVTQSWAWNLSSSLSPEGSDEYIIKYPFQSVCLPIPYFYLLLVISSLIIQFLFLRVAKTAIKLEKAINKHRGQTEIDGTQNNRITTNHGEKIQENKSNAENDDINHGNGASNTLISFGGAESIFEENTNNGNSNLHSSGNIFLNPKLGTSDFGISVNTFGEAIINGLCDDKYDSKNNINDYSDICKIIVNYGYTLNPTETAALNIFLKFIKYSKFSVYFLVLKMILRCIYCLFIIIVGATQGITSLGFQVVVSSLSSHLFITEMIHMSTIQYFYEKLNHFTPTASTLLHNLKDQDIDDDSDTYHSINLFWWIGNDLNEQNKRLKSLTLACISIDFGILISQWYFGGPISMFALGHTYDDSMIRFIALMVYYFYLMLGFSAIVVSKRITEQNRWIIQSRHVYMIGAIFAWIVPLYWLLILYLWAVLQTDNFNCGNDSIEDMTDNLNWYNIWYCLGWLFM